MRASAARHALPANVKPGREVPIPLLEHLADDPDSTVRARVAGHGDTPDTVRASLADDSDAQVRRTLAEWWKQAPGAVRRTLLTDPDPQVRAAAISPWHPPPPPDVHPMPLAHTATRAAVIPHIVLTPDLAADLAASADEQVRQALASVASQF